MARCNETPRMDVAIARLVLPTCHLTPHTSVVQVHANVLRIRPTSTAEARPFQGIGIGRVAHSEVQSMGRKRL